MLCAVGSVLIFLGILGFVLYRFFRLKVSPRSEIAPFERLLIGHRGCRWTAFANAPPSVRADVERVWADKIPENLKSMPENSLSAIEWTLQLPNVDAVEIDTSLNRDGIPVIMHDFSFDRMLGAPISVADSTLDDLKAHPFTDRPTETVPLLDDVICAVVRSNRKLMIEVKEVRHPRRMAIWLVNKFRSENLFGRCFVASFFPPVLYYVRSMEPGIVTMLLVARKLVSHWARMSGSALAPLVWFCGIDCVLDTLLFRSGVTWLPRFLGCGIVGLHEGLVSRDRVEAFQQEGIATSAWVVNNEPQRIFFRKELKISVTSDFILYPIRAEEELKAEKEEEKAKKEE